MLARLAKVGWIMALLGAGCSALNPLGFKNGDAEPLLPEAKAIKNAVPMPPPVPRELEKAPLPFYILEPGEQVSVRPLKPDSPAHIPLDDKTILPDGKIDLGEYGRVLVAGLSIEVATAQIQALVQAKTPDAGPIQVVLVGRSSKVFYVLGQVNEPGAFPLQGRETVLDGIVAAKGFNARASKNAIILSRPTLPDGCRIVLPICYRQVVQLGDTTTNYQLQPGDRIYVPAMTFFEGICGDKESKKGCSPCNGPQRGCPWDCGGAAH
jgi:polysaccharide export outer membrane protein